MDRTWVPIVGACWTAMRCHRGPTAHRPARGSVGFYEVLGFAVAGIVLLVGEARTVAGRGRS